MFLKSLLFLSAGFFSLASFAKDGALKVRADLWCPYNCEPADAKPGYMIEILQKAFGKENIEYATTNWAKAILETREGQYDVIVGASKDDAPDFILSEPVGVSKNCFYVKKGANSFKYTDIKSLESVKLGIIKDYAYFEDLNAYIKKNYSNRDRIEEHYGDDVQKKMFQKLDLGRLGTLVEDPNVADYTLDALPAIKDIVEVGCNEIGNLYIAFGPKNPKAAEWNKKLNATIDAMKKSGEYKELLKKYGLK